MVVHADPNQLQQVFLNMIITARDAMDGEGELRIETRERPRERRVEIVMHDEGCGIPQENMERIFEPFFSTKGDRGNGLGLAAVRSILEEHGGTVRVESSEGGGSTFTVILPAFPRSALEREGGRGMV